MSAKNAFSNALGFFKAQKKEEKKTKEENKFVKEVKESGEVPETDQVISSPMKNQQKISMI